MADLNKFGNPTLRAIEGAPEAAVHRPYLGMSKIGHSCPRSLWYSFRWCYEKEFSQRMLRLFNRGHREEPVIYAILEKIGIKVYDDQAEIVLAHGHGKGHCDGKCLGVIEAPKTEHLLEIKTMNDKQFKKMVKDKLKIAKPVYYAQMQIYMRKLKITRGLFIVVNKNDDQLYVERIKLDKGFADDLERKAETIVLSEAPPKKEFESTWFECKFCDARTICHGNRAVEKNCRTCQSVDLLPDGKWACSSRKTEVSTMFQRKGCESYAMLECLKKS